MSHTAARRDFPTWKLQICGRLGRPMQETRRGTVGYLPWRRWISSNRPFHRSRLQAAWPLLGHHNFISARRGHTPPADSTAPCGLTDSSLHHAPMFPCTVWAPSPLALGSLTTLNPCSSPRLRSINPMEFPALFTQPQLCLVLSGTSGSPKILPLVVARLVIIVSP